MKENEIGEKYGENVLFDISSSEYSGVFFANGENSKKKVCLTVFFRFHHMIVTKLRIIRIVKRIPRTKRKRCSIMRFDDGYHPTEPNIPDNPNVQPPTFSGSPQQSGSYYSPRSGESSSDYPGYGGTRSPYSGGRPNGPNPPGGGNYYDSDLEGEPKKPRSRKFLKAIAVFACVALIGYTSIQCYQFATEHESMQKFFGGKDASKISEEQADSDGSKQTNGNQASKTAQSSSSVVPQDWIQLAAREGAMNIPDIVDKVMPSSVGVSATFVAQTQSFPMWGFGEPQVYEKEMTGTGTGVIMSKDGYIITNAHVIFDHESQYKCGLAKEIQVVLNEECYEGETQFEAEVVGYDSEEDLAVLKINTDQELVPAEFGSSDELRVGELVIAIGNPLGFDLFGSVSTGIVSALNREMTINEVTMRLIQTDTAINAGNSGGPLINSFGQVVGINSAKLSSSYYGEASVEGLCFAIPMTHAKSVIDDLITFGFVRGKPLIGIGGQDVTESVSQAYGLPMGIYVREVNEGGAADLAGIEVGDIIIAVNGETVTTYEELNAMKSQFKAGDTITLTVTRNQQDIDFSVVLQEKQPVEEDAQVQG